MNIYDTFVKITSQEEAEELKQACIDNALPIDTESNVDFEVTLGTFDEFYYYEVSKTFCIIYDASKDNKTKVTKATWLKMLRLEKRKIP